MKKDDIDKIVGYLGRPYAELAAENIFPEVEFIEIYPGSDSIYILPEEGLGLDFLAENKMLKALHITLKETYEGTSVYKGELPEIFFREWIRRWFSICSVSLSLLGLRF